MEKKMETTIVYWDYEPGCQVMVHFILKSFKPRKMTLHPKQLFPLSVPFLHFIAPQFAARLPFASACNLPFPTSKRKDDPLQGLLWGLGYPQKNPVTNLFSMVFSI